MDEFDVLGRIEELCSHKGWSKYELAKRSNLPLSYISNMYNRANKPTINTLFKICNGLNITLAQFFTSSNSSPDLTAEQEELLRIWSLLDSEDKKLAFAYLKGLAKIL